MNNNIKAFEETLSFTATALLVPEAREMEQEIKERCNAYHQGLATLHELVMFVHDYTAGGTVQTLDAGQITIVFTTQLRLTDVITEVTIKL